MLNIYRDTERSIGIRTTDPLPDRVIWIDLLEPTDDERKFVERQVGVRLPTREALGEIEESSRLSSEKGHLYLTTPVIGNATIEDAEVSAAGFVLGPKMLVTIRYEALPTFDAVVKSIASDEKINSSIGVFVALLEAIVDRGADVLEQLGTAIDQVSRAVFRGNLSSLKNPAKSSATLRQTLSRVGALGDRLSKARDVLLGVARIASYTTDVGCDWLAKEHSDRLNAVSKDLVSLSDFETHLSDKIQFLLDAVLGYITIEQNDISRF